LRLSLRILNSDYFFFEKIGARVPGVDEPPWVGSQVLIEIEFEEVTEPKALLPTDLLQLVKVYGSYLKAAGVIGASEAFVRQNCFKRGSS
jgi:hypothetical protein